MTKPSARHRENPRAFHKTWQAAVSLLADTPAIPLVASAVIGAVGIASQFSVPLNHDVAWLLVATNRLLDGASIYLDDVIEVNPPLILYLFTPGVALARALSLPEIETMRCAVVALVLGIVLLCRTLLSHLLGENDAQLRRYLIAALLFANLAAVGYDFAQRDHFVALLSMPWLFACAVRMQKGPLSGSLVAVVGVCGGLALSLKPHYVLCYAVLELLLWVRTGSWRSSLRPEVGFLAATGAIYVTSVFLLTPSYFEVVLPLAADVYWVLERPLGSIVRPGDLLLLLAGAGAWLAIRVEPKRSLARVLVVAAAAFYAVMLLQGTGMTYHRVPLHSVEVLLGVLLAVWLVGQSQSAAAAQSMSARQRSLFGGTVAAIAAIAMLAMQPKLAERLESGLTRGGRGAEGIVSRLANAIEEHAAGGPVYFLSIPMHPAFPAVNYSGARWASRFSHLWILHATSVARAGYREVPVRLTPARLAAMDRYMIDALVEDLTRNRPTLIFVDHRVLAGLDSLDVLATLKRNPGFAAVWAHYELTNRRVGPFQLAKRRT